MREKYCWLTGDWKLVLERCERKILLGWLLELPNRVYRNPHLTFFFYELEANVNKRQTGLACGLTASKAFHSGGLACLFGEIETNFRWAAHPRVVLGLIRPKASCFISTPMRAALATVGRLRAKLSDPTWPTQALEED